MIRKLSLGGSQGIATITITRTEKNTAKPGNFEEAIKATGFGKFNISLLFILFFGSSAQIAEQTSLAYIIPIAECDLGLSSKQKGFLVSISYTGMIFSGFLWGYICDTYGRRKVIAFGYIANAVCHTLAAFSQSFTMLLISKWLSGFIFTGPFAAFVSYLTEFHSTENRSRIQLFRGLSTGIAVILLPMIAWGILPHIYNISLFNITLRSWNLFLAACSLPALITGIIFIYMPESPRYLMSSGKTTEALTVFKTVYNKNTGRRFSTFPIKILKTEQDHKSLPESTEEEQPSLKEKVRSGLTTLKPLFKPPLLIRLIHISLTNASLALGAFSVKMWYPQILQSINDNKHNSEADICDILNTITQQNSLAHHNSSDIHVCSINLDNSLVYINASILGAVQLMSFLLASTIVNKTGKKPLLVVLSCFSGCCPLLIYFIPNNIVIVGLLPLIVAFAEVSSVIVVTITLEVFPTTFRSTATNLLLMFSRLGISGGNIAIPYLLDTGCLPPLMFISVAIFVTTILASMLPNTDKKDLQ